MVTPPNFSGFSPLAGSHMPLDIEIYFQCVFLLQLWSEHLKNFAQWNNSMVSGTDKRVIIGIIVIVSFIVLAFNIFPFLGLTGHTEECSLLEGCPHEEELNFLEAALPIIISISLLIGAGVYYFMGQKVELKEKSARKSADIVTKFLNADEKKLVNLLVENNGKVLQAEVSRLPGMSKLKSHRVVQKLIDRGVIEKEKIGKTNIVKFSAEIREGLL